MNEDWWTVEHTDEWEQLLADVMDGDIYITRGDEPVAVLMSVECHDELTARLAELQLEGPHDAD